MHGGPYGGAGHGASPYGTGGPGRRRGPDGGNPFGGRMRSRDVAGGEAPAENPVQRKVDGTTRSATGGEGDGEQSRSVCGCGDGSCGGKCMLFWNGSSVKFPAIYDMAYVRGCAPAPCNLCGVFGCTGLCAPFITAAQGNVCGGCAGGCAGCATPYGMNVMQGPTQVTHYREECVNENGNSECKLEVETKTPAPVCAVVLPPPGSPAVLPPPPPCSAPGMPITAPPMFNFCGGCGLAPGACFCAREYCYADFCGIDPYDYVVHGGPEMGGGFCMTQRSVADQDSLVVVDQPEAAPLRATTEAPPSKREAGKGEERPPTPRGRMAKKVNALFL